MLARLDERALVACGSKTTAGFGQELSFEVECWVSGSYVELRHSEAGVGQQLRTTVDDMLTGNSVAIFSSRLALTDKLFCRS